jgi:hypothetical protein
MSSDMQMFITACCVGCKDSRCEGALFAKTRCDTWYEWQRLSEAERTKRFMTALTDEITFIEDLTNENSN